MRQSIVVVESDPARVAAMNDCLGDKFPFFERRFFRSAPEAAVWLTDHLPETALVGLGCDSGQKNGEKGDRAPGWMISSLLSQRAPVCPVVIHNINMAEAREMKLVLANSGWFVDQVTASSDDSWIAQTWLPTVRHAVVRFAISKMRPRP